MSELDEMRQRLDTLEYKVRLTLNVIRGSQRRLSRHFLDCGYDERTWEAFNQLFVEVSPTVTPTTTADEIVATFMASLPGLSESDVTAIFRELKRDRNCGIIVRRLFNLGR